MAKEREWSALVAAEVGHEVKNVLTIIQTLGSLLAKELPPDGVAVQLVDELLRTTDRAARLSHRLMQLARDTRSEGPADLAAAVQSQMPALRFVASRAVIVELQGCDHPVWTPLSTLDVQQLVFNLAHNALDAMPTGGRLLIQLSVADDMVALVVRDTGTGMDADTLRHCFDPFFTTKGANGTGLGLHAVRAAVARAGGRIAVESTVGHGTAVVVYLPVVAAGAS